MAHLPAMRTILGAGLLIGLAAAPPLAGQAPAQGTMVVHVVDVSTSRPLAGVRIYVRCFPREIPFGDYEGVTDAAGEWRALVQTGQCMVIESTLSGFATPVTGRRYDVASGETVRVVRRLSRWSSVAGTLRDEQGAPIAGAKVLMLGQRNAAGLPQWSSDRWLTVTTDERGGFVFPEGNLGNLPRRFEVPSVQLAGANEPFLLAPGEKRAVDLRGRRLPTFTVSGHLERAAAGPSVVTLFLDRAESSVLPITIAESRSDAADRFVFAAVPAGAYRIRVDTAGAAGGYTPSSILAANQRLTVTGDTTNVTVALAPGAEASGSVRFEGQTPAPADFVGVAFTFPPASGRGLAGPLLASGTVGTRFWTRALAPDAYFLSAAALPSGPWRLKSGMLDGQDITETPFDLRPGRAIDITVTFTDRETQIDGLIRDARGQEAPEATVAIFSTNAASWGNTNLRRVRVIEASQHGRFSVRNLPPGEYFVAAGPSAEMPPSTGSSSQLDLAALRRLTSSASRVTLEEDVALSLNLTMPASR